MACCKSADIEVHRTTDMIAAACELRKRRERARCQPHAPRSATCSPDRVPVTRQRLHRRPTAR
jgi:hypothetical protein